MLFKTSGKVVFLSCKVAYFLSDLVMIGRVRYKIKTEIGAK